MKNKFIYRVLSLRTVLKSLILKKYAECNGRHVKRIVIPFCRSIARSLDRSLAWSFARSRDRLLAISIAHSIARSIARSLAGIISNVRILNEGYSWELIGGSNFELLACIRFISPVSECRITFSKNYERAYLLFQGVSTQEGARHLSEMK